MSSPTESSPVSSSEPRRRRGLARRLIAVGIVALAVAVAAVAILPRLAASGPSTATTLCCAPQKAVSQVLSLSMLGSTSSASGQPDVDTLDPVAVIENDYANTETQLVHLLFDGLVTTDDANNVELWGADHVAVSSDGLTYTFDVRENQSYSDGTPVKASDYAWSIDRALNPCIANQSLALSPPQATGLAVIKDGLAFATERCASDHNTVQGAIKTLIGDSLVPDDSADTLTISLAHPAAYFLAILTQPDASVIERQVVNGLGADGAWFAHLTDGPTGRGGSGMFYLASRDDMGNLVLKPNPHWWGQSAGKRPNFTEVDVHLYQDSQRAYGSFTNAPADYLDAIPSSYLAGAATRPDYHVVPALEVESVAFNWKMAPFNNVDVRQALCLAINRDTIARQYAPSPEVAAASMLLTPSWHLVPQGMPGYDPQLTGIDGVTTTSGDLAKAQAHWLAYRATLNGHSATPVVFTYVGLPSSRQGMLAATIAAQWSQALPGIEVSAAILPDIELQYGDFPVQAIDLRFPADYPDPQDFLSFLYSTSSGFNLWRSSVPSADTLLATADALSDPTEQASRLNRYNQAEQQLVQQVATCPLFQYQAGYLLRTDIYGLRQNGMGIIADDDWVNGYRTVP